jgi:hypothetical protein
LGATISTRRPVFLPPAEEEATQSGLRLNGAEFDRFNLPSLLPLVDLNLRNASADFAETFFNASADFLNASAEFDLTFFSVPPFLSVPFLEPSFTPVVVSVNRMS